MNRLALGLFCACSLGLSATSQAQRPYRPSHQEILESYKRADAIPALLRGKALNLTLKANWIQGAEVFTYVAEKPNFGKTFMLVNVGSSTKAPAFDHAKLATSLSKLLGRAVDQDKLPFNSINLAPDLKTVRFSVEGAGYSCDLSSYEIKKQERAKAGPPSNRPDGDSNTSPDKQWDFVIKDANVWLRDVKSRALTQVTTDGKKGSAYIGATWAPDSKSLVCTRMEDGDNKNVYVIESSPKGGGRAILHTRQYDLPGDKMSIFDFTIVDVDSKKATRVDAERIDFSWDAPWINWSPNSKHFQYVKLDRGHQRDRLYDVDVATGKARVVIDETAKTFINNYGTPKVHYLNNLNQIVYKSEQDGWNQLYLYDLTTGNLINRITQGAWVVRDVETIDENSKQIWFKASGVNAGEDPYNIHYYRSNLDGTGMVSLTPAVGNHTIEYSPDRKYFVDTYSQPDTAPTHELRRSADGSLVMVVEKADISALKKTGWQTPEVFTAKGRDGKTDIWGVIIRPSHFDPHKKYPVIEDIYAGPHDSFVPKSFGLMSTYHAIAELGFIVVKMDGMGTSNRSKAFHDVCWQNVADAGFADRILWMQAVKKKYSYLDLDRVGIYGTSAGGQSSTGALLFHPEFYKVAVSSCGCHDNRMDKESWNEQWMGYPVGPWYEANSNITHAKKLQGKLMLYVGEMDSNVPPESTIRLLDAFIKAGKDVDFLILPGMDHTDGGPYGERRRRDYFVRHLLGVEPPDRNATK